MRIVPDAILTAQLIKLSRKDLLKGFDVEDSDYERYRDEVRILHPKYTEEQKHRWAAYAALYAKEHKSKKPAGASKRGSRFDFVWKLIIAGLLVFLCAREAKCGPTFNQVIECQHLR